MPSEIQEFINPRRESLLEYVRRLKGQNVDYAFVLFSGHGGQRLETILELNAHGETINESDLWNISNRQVNIYDCCRSIIEDEVRNGVALEGLTKSFTANSNVRERYDQRIMQAIPQQVKLYACSVGQSAYDSGNGAIYLGHLLDSAKSIGQWDQFMTVESAHEQARASTIRSSRLKGNAQEPDASLPKCLISQTLILSIKP